jgi:hypothetical protein
MQEIVCYCAVRNLCVSFHSNNPDGLLNMDIFLCCRVNQSKIILHPFVANALR